MSSYVLELLTGTAPECGGNKLNERFAADGRARQVHCLFCACMCICTQVRMCVFNSFWTTEISCPWSVQNRPIQSPCIGNCPPLIHRVSFENHIDLRCFCYSKLLFVFTYFDFVLVQMFHSSFRLLTTSPLIFPGDFLHSPQWVPCNKLWLHQIYALCASSWKVKNLPSAIVMEHSGTNTVQSIWYYSSQFMFLGQMCSGVRKMMNKK